MELVPPNLEKPDLVVQFQSGAIDTELFNAKFVRRPIFDIRESSEA